MDIDPVSETRTWMCLICGWIYDEAEGDGEDLVEQMEAADELHQMTVEEDEPTDTIDEEATFQRLEGEFRIKDLEEE